MKEKFIKIFDDDECFGYLSLRDIYKFLILETENEKAKQIYMVMACESCESAGDGWQVSPEFKSRDLACEFMENLVDCFINE